MKYTIVDESLGGKITQVYEGTPEEIANLQDLMEIKEVIAEMETDMLLGDEDG